MKRIIIPFVTFLIVIGVQLTGGTKANSMENDLNINENIDLIIEEKDGFVHPGISVDPEKLENTRKELIQGNDPWKSYYKAMKETKYASLVFESTNLKDGTIDTPKDSTFKNSSRNVNLSNDGFRAYTQAVLYYLTGESQYRYNAIRLVRIWENMDPNEYEYYGDAHIHVGTPFYYMVSAAELLKYTTVVNEVYNDEQNNIENYNLLWTEEDTNKLTKNLIDPVINTFLYSNYRYLNQHTYPVIGAMAGYIFKNDKGRYEEAVEWAMVNSTTEKPDINGALQNQFHLIESNHPQNPTGKSYIQHLEMGRDQAHGSGDVINFTGIARILTQQKTKIDPTKGTVSQAENAQTPYAFLDQRILDGADQLYSYMGGYTIPWTELGDQDFQGPVSEAYRGRTGLYFSMSELYDAYRYQEGMSNEQLEKRAPQISFMAKNLTSPIFYNGTTKTNFWGSLSDNKMTEIGSEYWLSIPSERNEDSSLSIPSQIKDSPAVSFGERAAMLDNNLAYPVKEGNSTYIRVKSAKTQKEIKETNYDALFPVDTKTIRGGNQIALPSLIKKRGDGNDYLSLRIRSTGEAKLLISGNNYYDEAYQEVYIPNTNGEWENITYTTNSNKQISRTARQLENLDFYSVISNTDVQVDFDKLEYINNVNVPTFTENNNQTFYLIKNVPFERKLINMSGDNSSLSLVNPPKGMIINQDGTIKWTPEIETNEPIKVTVIVDNGQVMNAITIQLVVSSSKDQAYEQVLSTFDENQVYTNSSYQKFTDNKEVVESLIEGNANTVDILTALNNLVTDIANLELLNPKLEDGTFNYYAYDSIISSVTTMNKDNIVKLLDDDTATHSGDLRAPIIFDFGSEYRIAAKSFSLQARRGFTNRTQGTNVYGSNDGVNWTLLTESMTTKTDALERIPVKADLVNEAFRYIKFQVDSPAASISSYSEIRIEGTRKEQ
ncbi:discoidin domain-containing protein [Niallia sp. Man26]|uniref:discoidin domain-containing protein n=1 Tax=Niallia sp. Man26 TaxID=2912824 RepID=UPI001EDC3A52|nr:discoidin domain-containing protein [Niallia sp. Man26]UPO90123.1 discoidin domain-containing protein [Niallia sp. Man26]